MLQHTGYLFQIELVCNVMTAQLGRASCDSGWRLA